MKMDVNAGLRGKAQDRPRELSEEGCQRPGMRLCGQDWVTALGVAGRALLIAATD